VSIKSLRENSFMATPQLCPSCAEVLPEDSSDCPRCLAETLDKPLIPVPLIAAFKMIRLLGRGGMGSVYLAEDNTLKRPVAIKIISKELTQDSRGRNRFLREGRAMATVDHPHIVHFYSVGEFSGQPYIVMEYVEGETLAERIKRNGALPIEETLRIMGQTVEALDAAWEKQIIHRDIKPSNILLDKKGEVRVADFGLAKTLQIEKDSSLTQSGSIIGSPHYISPEQAQGQNADYRSDIYALGIVLYEMLVGERPFEDTTPLAIVLKHLNTPMPSPREKRKNLPESVVRLLFWMTRKDPKKRPASYRQLLEKIDSLLNDQKKIGKSVFEKSRISLMLGVPILVVAIAISIQLQKAKLSNPPLTRSSPPSPTALAPPKTMTVVTINALPWAHVKLTPATKGIDIPVISEKERITPCYFLLPEGEYSIELVNDIVSRPVLQTIKVQASKDNSFQFTMPAYDPNKALAQIRGVR
jgi:serine/threonine protein kinase